MLLGHSLNNIHNSHNGIEKLQNTIMTLKYHYDWYEIGTRNKGVILL